MKKIYTPRESTDTAFRSNAPVVKVELPQQQHDSSEINLSEIETALKNQVKVQAKIALQQNQLIEEAIASRLQAASLAQGKVLRWKVKVSLRDSEGRIEEMDITATEQSNSKRAK